MRLLDVAEGHAVVLAVPADLEVGGLGRDRLAVAVPASGRVGERGQVKLQRGVLRHSCGGMGPQLGMDILYCGLVAVSQAAVFHR